MNILVKNNFTPDIWLKNASIPVVLILAENDEVVGFKQGMKLADVIPESNKTVHVVEGAGHNSIYDMQGFSSFFTNVIAK
jgi:pimeloyl-ACP methyl ester carboxylesterase